MGQCKAGAQTCDPDGLSWSACSGEVVPAVEETCNAPGDPIVDENCNGLANEGVCKFVAVAAGGRHSLVLRQDGKVFAWGKNADGQLGNGDATGTEQLKPVEVQNAMGTDALVGVKAISAGGDHSIALLHDGTVVTWGKNSTGQLCDGTTTKRVLPATVVEKLGAQNVVLTGVMGIAAGAAHTVLRRMDGTVWSCGANQDGQVVNGGGQIELWATQVLGVTQVAAVGAGGTYSFAIDMTDKVHAWGDNLSGQLGLGTFTLNNPPVSIAGISAVMVDGGNTFTLAALLDGTVKSWGSNDYGELGWDSMMVPQASPTSVPSVTGAIAVAAGVLHGLALTSTNELWSWGYNAYGQLGVGSMIDKPPGKIPPNIYAGFVGIAAGDFHSLALPLNGSPNIGEIVAWGLNDFGQVGDGTKVNRIAPAKVVFP